MMANIRLIDANALDLRNRVQMDMGGLCFLEDVETVIGQAPTIDPETLRPVGRWHLNEDGKWACTYCDGLAVEHPDKPDEWQALTRCCPNCGARMKGENNE